MTHRFNSKRTVDIDTILEKSETSLKEQVKQFIAQSGKQLAIVILTISTFLITGQVVPDSLFITTYVLVPLLVFGLIIYLIVNSYMKQKNELRSDLMSLASSHKKLGDDLVSELLTMEKRLIGRINTLETYTPFGILEMDRQGNLVRANATFSYITGYNENTLNELLKGIPQDMRGQKLAEILGEASDIEKLAIEFTSRIAGDTEIRELKDLYLKNKNGIAFPATIRVALIHDNRGLVTQFFVSDDTDFNAMHETIQAQNQTINSLIGAFTKHHNEREFTDRLIKQLEESKIEIRTELKK